MIKIISQEWWKLGYFELVSLSSARKSCEFPSFPYETHKERKDLLNEEEFVNRKSRLFVVTSMKSIQLLINNNLTRGVYSNL